MTLLRYAFAAALVVAVALAAGCPWRQPATTPRAVAPALAGDPVDSLMPMGKQAFRAGQYDDAEALFTRVRKLRPNLLEAESYLGQCALAKKQYEQAAADFKDVTTRQAMSATAWLGLGQAYEGLQRSAEAAPCYQTALSLAPRSEPARQGFLRVGAPKKIAITIDDGPSLVYTMKAIEESERYGGRVTFFCEGTYCARDVPPQIIRQMQAHGEEIGNHSYSHPMLTKLPEEKVRWELGHTNDLIVAQGGTRPTFFRPPYGDHNALVDNIAGELGMKVVLWDIDTEDWKTSNPPSRTVQYILTHARPNSVVLMHQVHNTYTALDQIFKGLHDQGFICVRLDELGRYPTKIGG